jgi:hypothetical protein
MKMRRKMVGVTAGAVGGLFLIGPAAYLVAVGLDKADKIASAIGAIGGLIGLG